MRRRGQEFTMGKVTTIPLRFINRMNSQWGKLQLTPEMHQ